MSKVLDATCQAGVVLHNGQPVPAAEIMSEGVGQSAGVVVLDESRAYYLAKTSEDLKTTLDKVIAALGKVASAIQALDTNGFLIAADAGVPSGPVAAADIAEINTISGELNALKAALK